METQTPPDTPPPPQPPPKIPTYKLTASSISYSKSTTTSTTTATSPFHLLFKPCSSTPPTTILNNVSFTAFPSEILAIVGPSGAGKSTLLDILAARTSPTAGSLLLNSSPIANPSLFRKLSAYVPQHDASLPLLTVFETFAFSASLLNPASSSSEKIQTLVASLLDELALAHVANTRLAEGKLSGGERRRVSIGLAVLHDPGVLLLDEPTSGLDSKSALMVIQTVRHIATSRKRTVVLSIHQPGFKILSMIDRVLLLCKGNVVHYGSLPSLESYLLSKGFTVPDQLNALEYAMEIIGQLSVDDPTVLSPSPDQIPPDDDRGCDNNNDVVVKYRSSRIHEISLLHSRLWKIIFRTKQLLLTNTIQALVVGLVLGTIYINVGINKQGIEKRFGLFAFTLTFLLSSTTETLPIFINERPIILQEASGGLYRISSYLLANTLVFLPYFLVVSIVYSVSLYFLVGLCATWQAFAYFLVVVWIILLMANSFVLFLSSVAPNYIAGTTLVTVILAGFFLFSGYFISESSMPKYWLFMHYLSMYKYALDALLVNEYSCHVNDCFFWYGGEGSNGIAPAACVVTGADVLKQRGIEEELRWRNVYVLIGFFVFYRLLCLVALTRRISRSKK
ncbi:ABC transporter G family member 8 [Linum grandiflorum]